MYLRKTFFKHSSGSLSLDLETYCSHIFIYCVIAVYQFVFQVERCSQMILVLYFDQLFFSVNWTSSWFFLLKSSKGLLTGFLSGSPFSSSFILQQNHKKIQMLNTVPESRTFYWLKSLNSWLSSQTNLDLFEWWHDHNNTISCLPTTSDAVKKAGSLVFHFSFCICHLNVSRTQAV